MEHSAHPRIESVATYVLTIPEPPEPPITECEPYSTIGEGLTFTLIGEGSDGTIVLDDDAPVSGTGIDGRAVVVLIGTCHWGDDTNGTAIGSLTISDDSPEDFPPYLDVGGQCYSDTWRTKSMGFAFSQNAHNFGGTGPHEDDSVIIGGAMALKWCQSPMPAGTTITYSYGCDKSEAKAFLVEGISPYTSSPHASNGSGDISVWDDEGGIAFVHTIGDNAETQDCIGSPLFDGLKPTGPLTTAGGTEVMNLSQMDIEYISWSGTHPACSHTDVELGVDMKWYIVPLAPGSGSTYNIALAGDTGGISRGAGWAWPGVGY